ncbi:toxin-antitoxin system HicB family antitoxin [Nostoc sp. UIC 10607]|uniref:toxin-antitoxin system HicB family antitoxin n=1 Tax=Nostoc sp. UIC 10607 TaxID=3045935 RepID=UPI0039A286F0
MASSFQAFNLRLPEELDSQVKAQAQQLGISKHQFIIDAIAAQLGDQAYEYPAPATTTLADLQAQVDRLQKQFKILAEHCGNPLGTW